MNDGFRLLAALQARVDALWARAGRHPAERLLSRATRQDTYWYVETEGERVRCVQWERGREEPLTGWLTLSEATHWVLAGLAAAAAQAEELRERERGGLGYSRWNWMAPAIALMHRISLEHGAAMTRKYDDVLTQAPLNEEERRLARWPLPE